MAARLPIGCGLSTYIGLLLGCTLCTVLLAFSRLVMSESSSIVKANQTAGRVRVFHAGGSGVACFRIPAVVQTAGGTLLAFAEARELGCADNSALELFVSRSTDNGRSWSEASPVIGGVSLWVSNPWPIARRSGPVLLLYTIRAPSPDYLGESNGVVVSEDDGVSWGPGADIGDMLGAARGAFFGPGAGVELEGSGRLLAVSHLGEYEADYVSYSDDGGRTWATAPQAFEHMDEATLADLGGGGVLANMRHLQEGVLGRGVARSNDGGLTWGELSFDPQLPGPICEGSLARIGRSVYFSNPANRTRRKDLTIRRSNDGGASWTARMTVERHPRGGYSSLLQGALRDSGGGRSGILFESASGSIDFATFPLDFADEAAPEYPEDQLARTPIPAAPPRIV